MQLDLKQSYIILEQCAEQFFFYFLLQSGVFVLYIVLTWNFSNDDVPFRQTTDQKLFISN